MKIYNAARDYYHAEIARRLLLSFDMGKGRILTRIGKRNKAMNLYYALGNNHFDAQRAHKILLSFGTFSKDQILTRIKLFLLEKLKFYCATNNYYDAQIARRLLLSFADGEDLIRRNLNLRDEAMKIFHVSTDYDAEVAKRVLLTYADGDKSVLNNFEKNYSKEIFLDSGAYGVFTGKARVELRSYCNFLHEHKEKFAVYAALDVIGNADASLKNYLFMKDEEKLEPLPCWHAGESLDLLKEYFNHTDYVGIGGLVPLARRRKIRFEILDSVFDLVTAETLRKIHLFGVSDTSMLLKYPAYSCDSSSAQKMRSNGRIYRIQGIHLVQTQLATPSWRSRAKKTFDQMAEYEDLITEVWKRRGIEWKD
jgi:hypothetical protein